MLGVEMLSHQQQCSMTREDLDAKLEGSGFGENQIMYHAYFHTDENGGAVCKACQKSIGSHPSSSHTRGREGGGRRIAAAQEHSGGGSALFAAEDPYGETRPNSMTCKWENGKPNPNILVADLSTKLLRPNWWFGPFAMFSPCCTQRIEFDLPRRLVTRYLVCSCCGECQKDWDDDSYNFAHLAKLNNITLDEPCCYNGDKPRAGIKVDGLSKVQVCDPFCGAWYFENTLVSGYNSEVMHRDAVARSEKWANFIAKLGRLDEGSEQLQRSAAPSSPHETSIY